MKLQVSVGSILLTGAQDKFVMYSPDQFSLGAEWGSQSTLHEKAMRTPKLRRFCALNLSGDEIFVSRVTVRLC